MCVRACIYVRDVYSTDHANTRAITQQHAATRADTRLLSSLRRDPFISRSSWLSRIFRILRSCTSRIIGASIHERKFCTPDSLAHPSSVRYLFSPYGENLRQNGRKTARREDITMARPSGAGTEHANSSHDTRDEHETRLLTAGGERFRRTYRRNTQKSR